jgi:glycosyltransferase involved in cell wall biosynthesis
VVQVSGFLTGTAKSKCYATASVFCFLTDYEPEIYPLVILEASQAGLPIVASRWRGIPDMVTEGRSAILVEPHDIAGATQALRMLLTNDEQRSEMAAASRECSTAHYTRERYWRSLDEVFRALGNT